MSENPRRPLVVLGRILTMDPPGSQVEAAVVVAGRFSQTGSRELMSGFPDAEVLDFGQRLITPGLIDAHNHLSGAAMLPLWVNCSGISTIEALGAILTRGAAELGDDGWVRGYGWNPAEGLFPTRHDLDQFIPNRPVVLAHFSFHGAVVNSLALEQLGITRNTPDIPGGRIERDKDGEPNGVLMEQAWREAHVRSMEQYTRSESWADLICERVKVLHKHGITSVHDAACPPEAEAVYKALEREGQLGISVVVMPHSRDRADHSLADRLDGPLSGEGTDSLRIGAAKFYADGVNPEPENQSEEDGGPPFVAPGARASAIEASDRGFRLAVHAMFNHGVEAALAVFEQALKRHPNFDHRFRIEHAGVVTSDQMKKMADLGVIASVQPCFIQDTADLDIGPDSPPIYPFRTLLEHGIRLAGGTDDPANTVDSLSLLWGSSLGVTRRNTRGRLLFPEETVGFEDWLAAFTAGAAYAGGQEKERGSITAGKVADFVVLDGELDATDPPEVLETWISGKRVYARP